MKIPKAELHKPEVLEEHPKLENTIKAALAATVIAGLYHHHFRNGSIVNIESKFRAPPKGWDNAEHDPPIDDESPHFNFSLLVDAGKRRLFGKVFPPEKDLARVGEDESRVVIEENDGITVAEIGNALSSDNDENTLQTP